jgi:hypothetical protein
MKTGQRNGNRISAGIVKCLSKKLIWFMLGMVKGSTQNALERFFPKLQEATHMSQQAFSLARQKVKAEP